MRRPCLTVGVPHPEAEGRVAACARGEVGAARGVTTREDEPIPHASWRPLLPGETQRKPRKRATLPRGRFLSFPEWPRVHPALFPPERRLVLTRAQNTRVHTRAHTRLRAHRAFSWSQTVPFPSLSKLPAANHLKSHRFHEATVGFGAATMVCDFARGRVSCLITCPRASGTGLCMNRLHSR